MRPTTPPVEVDNRYGRLTVLGQAPDRTWFSERLGRTLRAKRWRCRCDCGKELTVEGSTLRHGQQSCGCIRIEKLPKTITHGHSTNGVISPEYSVWQTIRRRCYDPRHVSYPQYGARGIVVCARWSNFQNFLIDMGKRPSLEHQIERINNNGNYEPMNCRWATAKEQARNRRSNRRLTINGETRCVTEWAHIVNLRPNILFSRIYAGWPVESLFLPVKKGPNKGAGGLMHL